LWPRLTLAAHVAELTRSLAARDERTAAFIARSVVGEVIGFAEAALRTDTKSR